MPLMREGHQLANGQQNLFADALGGQRAIFRDEFPNIADVLGGAGMKVEVFIHRGACC